MYESMESFVETVFECPNEGPSEPKKRVRKLKEKWTSELTEKLVKEVEKREGTWNFLSKEYRDRSLRETLWQDVADTMNMPRSEVATKWNSLRCSFRVSSFNMLMLFMTQTKFLGRIQQKGSDQEWKIGCNKSNV